MSEAVPNPGSNAALEQGCICPVMDNWRGDPMLGEIRGFVEVVGCPLHSAVHVCENCQGTGIYENPPPAPPGEACTCTVCNGTGVKP